MKVSYKHSFHGLLKNKNQIKENEYEKNIINFNGFCFFVFRL